MFNIGSYIAAGFALLLALQYVAPADASLAYRDIGATASFHQVNRAEKSDRLAVPKSEAVSKPREKILVGCDPAFSNLSAHARLNFASRCIS